MWGNRLGWVISAVLVGVVAYPLYLGSQPPRVSTPSGAFPNLMASIELPLDPKGIVPAAMQEPCDAGEVYRQAMDDYYANTRQYEKYLANTLLAAKERPKGVELILAASRCSEMKLFARSPIEVLNYKAEDPAMQSIYALGRMANQRGMLHASNKGSEEARKFFDPQLARKYFDATFALGYQLYRERLAWSELEAGLNLMEDAALGLAGLELQGTNPGRAADLKHFAEVVRDYKLKQFELYKVVSSIDTNTVGHYGGDIIALARSSPEPMWRAEAILALGRMRYNTSRRGDQRAAERELQQWTTDPNPAVRAAANAAASLTVQQYRALH
jgi:hypothetical protein